MQLSMQHNHRCGAGVFARIMMVELQVQRALEVFQPMSAIALQLGPSPSRDLDAIAPAQIRGVDATETAGGIHCLLVEVAVLDEVVTRQQWQQSGQGVREAGRIRHMIWANAVELDVERVKPGAGIDQHGEGLDLVVGLDAGQADLADAGGITASGFDIQRDEAEAALRHPDRVR